MAEYDLAGLCVLVIDDSLNMRVLVRSILTAFGIQNIAEAADGSEALEVMQEFEADLLIVDWKMQPMDGIEFTRYIRAGDDSPDRYVPIIMLTGLADAKRVLMARDAGVNEFLAKPVSAAQLYHKIRSIIETPRQFVRTPTYIGPDRRRRNDPSYTGPDRRRP